MLFYLSRFSDAHIFFNLFQYVTVRAAGGLVTALLLAFALGPATIRWLTRLKVGQVVRELGPESHRTKAGTPTMGGAIIIMAAAVSTFLWAIPNWYTVLCLLALIWMGAIGFLDDYLKVVKRKTRGLIGRLKMAGQLTFALGLGILLVLNPIAPYPTEWTGVPFLADQFAHLAPWAFVVLVALVIAGSSNAVNLTDGLDGLAAGLAAIAAVTFAALAYITGRGDWAEYLGLFYLPGAQEMTIFGLALSGGSMGFLWFNAHPAEVFMGDTGSLAIGGALGVMAILLKSEFLLVIVGGVFVMEAVSVMLQVGVFKYTQRRFGTGRRVFRMAPIHHHFEQLGWPESKVVIRFWILGILCAMVAVSTLKIR
ncbi:MAG: phospho-N-acetylmuramoyl-pentapeptide-transferase [Gemmatimonadales bacterium]|jgi:phospho-N-acetylmuramoyl-pentapeptide-transferase|nr:MAG: phospho-N-acetylmuramoyl-pentapeptide-transferase [Gemmatimonadales bacterium]